MIYHWILLTVLGSLNLVFQVIDRTFGLDPGFYWQTLETPEHVCRGRETTQALHTEVSVSVNASFDPRKY